MVNDALYGILVVCFLLTAFGGRPALLYAAALLMPLGQVLPSPAGMPSAPVNLMLIGFVLWAWSGKGPGLARAAPLPLRVPIVAMVAALALGVAVRGIGETLGTAYLLPFDEVLRSTWYRVTPFVIYFLVFRRIPDEESAWRVVVCCQFSIAIEGAITIYEIASGIGRATAHIEEANRAGAYFAAASGLFLAWTLASSGRRRWIYLFAWICTSFGVFNSLSRGGLVAMVVSCTLVMVVFVVRQRGMAATKILAIVFAVVVVTNVALFLPERVIERVKFTFEGGGRDQTGTSTLDDSAGQRLVFWNTAWSLFKARPWGYGSQTFPQYLYDAVGIRKQAHNIYLEILVEYGAQGFLALIVLVVATWTWLAGKFGALEGDRWKTHALGLLGWWTGHTAAHVFVNPFFNAQITGQFWLMLAALAAVAAGQSASRTKAPAPAHRSAASVRTAAR